MTIPVFRHKTTFASPYQPAAAQRANFFVIRCLFAMTVAACLYLMSTIGNSLSTPRMEKRLRENPAEILPTVVEIHLEQTSLPSKPVSKTRIPRPLETSFQRLPEMRLDPQMVQKNSIDTSLKRTEAGVDISDPRLYDASIDYNGDSSRATVMGMATGYPLEVYQRFVGSLRKTGYKGHIILGVSPDVSKEILDYLEYRNVSTKILKLAPCTFQNNTDCPYPYLDLKTRWSRFPLQRDWLEDCPSCTGPILTTDVRDTFFQLDPFGPGSPVVKGLFVMEEHASQRTTHWLTDVPFQKCKGIHLDEVMLCSGTTIGARDAMMKYFQVMHEEMKAWASDPHCRFSFKGDDQSIHNYLYYSGQLPFATAWPNRAGGIVNTIGVEASIAEKEYKAQKKQKNTSLRKNDLGLEYNLTNSEGLFTEADGLTISRVVHQGDRFKDLWNWVTKHQEFLQDPFPVNKS